MKKYTFEELPDWQREMFMKLLNSDFIGINEIRNQIYSAKFEILNQNGTLAVYPKMPCNAPVVKTIPVEAYADDVDRVTIQVLLFTTQSCVSFLEILREDSLPVIKLPPVDKFTVMILGE